AVEILHRDLGVPIRDLTGTDIAYDVHVRRVFLRTRLVESDDLDHMVEVAAPGETRRARLPGLADRTSLVRCGYTELSELPTCRGLPEGFGPGGSGVVT